MQVKYGLIVMLPSDWLPIKEDLIKTYGASIMISWKLKRELGFTVRYHKRLAKYSDENAEWKKYVDEEWMENMKNRFYYQDQIHLDFYSESAKTMFLLRYTGFSAT